LATCYLRASYICCEQVLFLPASVCKSVCLSAKNIENYWSEIDVTWQEYNNNNNNINQAYIAPVRDFRGAGCSMVNARNDWKLVTFDVDFLP